MKGLMKQRTSNVKRTAKPVSVMSERLMSLRREDLTLLVKGLKGMSWWDNRLTKGSKKTYITQIVTALRRLGYEVE